MVLSKTLFADFEFIIEKIVRIVLTFLIQNKLNYKENVDYIVFLFNYNIVGKIVKYTFCDLK